MLDLGACRFTRVRGQDAYYGRVSKSHLLKEFTMNNIFGLICIIAAAMLMASICHLVLVVPIVYQLMSAF